MMLWSPSAGLRPAEHSLPITQDCNIAWDIHAPTIKSRKEWKREAREWKRAGPRVFRAPVVMLLSAME